MVLGQCDLYGFGVEREEAEPVGLDREPDERDVDGAFEECLGLVPPAESLDLDVEVRVAVGEGA